MILNPLAFAALLADLARSLGPGRLQPHSFVLTVDARVVDVSLRWWLAFFTASAWLGVLVIRPVLYDEERQLLFLYFSGDRR